ncbi:MAG: serine/threonine-protein kinase [Planctomycetota bacterium]
MTDVTLSFYSQLLSDSELLSSQEVSESYQRFRESITDSEDAVARESDVNAFAEFLIREQVLTKWQNAHLMRGRTKGLKFGKFRVLRLLGAGGMGRVFLAEDEMLRREVALKVLPKSRLKNDRAIKRFHLEARALAKLDHPNIVRFYDVDVREQTHYIVMEYVCGTDLAKLVSKSGPLDGAQAAHFIRQAAAGLEHAHQAGLIHRDIKPGNLLVDASGTLKILDLGLALLQSDDDESITVDPSRTLGTVDYLSPEQAINSRELDHRTDVYSLGCTMHCLLTGSAPFANGTNAQRLMAHQNQAPPDINTARAAQSLPPIDDYLVTLCRRMMHKDPNERIASAAVVMAALRNTAGGPGNAMTSTAISGDGDTMAGSGDAATHGATLPAASLSGSPSSTGSNDTSRPQSFIRIDTSHNSGEKQTTVKQPSKRGAFTAIWFAGGIIVSTISLAALAYWVAQTSATQPSGTDAALNSDTNIESESPPGPSALSNAENETIRYVVGDSQIYHRETCRHVRGKDNVTRVRPGQWSGLRACKVCDPDQ